MDMLRVRILFAMICVQGLTASFSYGSQSAPKSTAPNSDYSKESFLITNLETHVRLSASGTATRSQSTSIKVLSQAGVQAWGVLSFPYASDNEHVDVHFVRVHKADGSIVTTPAVNAIDLPSEVTRAAPMYSDLKQKQIPVRSLDAGDTLEFEVNYVQDKPLVAGQFWFTYSFNRSVVLLKEVLEVRVPRGSHPKIANADLKPVITENDTERVYTWTTANTAPSKPEGDEEQPELPQKPSVQISTFTSWQQVGEWYAKLAQPQAKVTPEIQTKADALVKGIPPGQGQIQAIYDFVSTHIHYIGLSFGIGRYQPHAAADVLENGYGDCKDKHTLLAALLKAEGVDSWPVLINSSEKVDEDVPSPGQFDHLITIIPQGKDYLWLDSTPEVAPYSMLLSNLRDKQALVVPPSAPSFLLKTPASPPFPSEDHMTMRGDLDNSGTFKGHGDLTLRGDNEVIYRVIFHTAARAKWQDVMQAVSYRLGFGGEVSNVQVDDPDATRQAFHIAWDYQRKKYGDWDNRQITPPTGGVPINFISEEKKPRSPIQVGAPGTTLYDAELTLPPGSTMEAPANVDLKTAFAEYHAKYSIEKGKYLTERRITILQKEVPIESWQSYLSFQKEITQDYNHMSSITVPGAEMASSSSTSNPEAADLVDKASHSLQDHELNLAQDQLDKAKKLNPHELNLNTFYGSLYMSQGKTEEGIEAFRLELKEHPDNLRIARWFAQMLARMNRNEDAIDVNRSILKSVPDDIDSNSELSRLYVAKEDWKNAQPVLEKAIVLRPDNAQIQIWYGQSCLKNGKETEGLAALKIAAATSTDPSGLAAIANALADSGKALDIAQHAAQQALSLVEAKTKDFSLTDITNAQMKQMTDLAQAWNSMSWTAFKTGDIATAEKYAYAAWALAQEPSAGDHLAQIYEKQGKTALALDTYKLAKARGYPVVPGMDDRIAALEKRAGHNSSIGDNGASHLQDLRMVHLARAKSVSASADFLILFSGGKVSDVKMIGGDPAVAEYASLLKQAKFKVAFPDEGPEHVVRQGILSCSVYDPKCMFLMMLPAEASTNSRSGISIKHGETKTIQLKQ